MKIGFDGKRAVQNHTGLGNYSRYVIEALQEYYPENKYLLYAPKRKDNPRLRIILENSNIEMRLPVSHWWKHLPSLWRILGITDDLIADDIAIFHGLSNELPLNICKQHKVKTIVTVHDLIFRRLPECYPAIDRWIYDYKFRKACRNADLIIAVSECTKRDIISDYGISPDKIKVIYQGCDPSFAMQVSEKDKNEIRKRYSLPMKYILSVGTIEERKNALLAVKALRGLPEDCHLVLVGRETSYVTKIKAYVKEYDLGSRVHLLQGVPFSDLPAIYQCAEVFVYPSRYEGFGIPILEALNSRIPVVAAVGSCLEEAGGPHSLYVKPDDTEGLIHAISNAMCTEQRVKMVEKGILWASLFTKGLMAGKIMECYEGLHKK